MLVHGYGDNRLRRIKTDKKDTAKQANYGRRRDMPRRRLPGSFLKNCCRQYELYARLHTVLKNNLLSLLDAVFPEANRLFSSPPSAGGSEKWVILRLLSDTVNAFQSYLSKPLPPGDRNGAKNTAMPKRSAGLVLHRKTARPGFWRNKLWHSSKRCPPHCAWSFFWI